MSTKLFAAEIKASGPDDGLEEGQFEAYASVFGNIDSYNDIVVKGAFLESLAEWKASGSPIPLLFGHNMSDPDYNIGHIVDAKEDDHGLLVRAQLDMQAPKGAATYRLLKGRRVSQMSFAYKVLDSGPIEVDGVKGTELRKLHIYEVSVVPVGANDQTEVLSVKAGRVLSAKNAENVKKAISALDVVREDLSALLDAATNDDSKASVRPVVKDEELSKVNGNEPEELSKVNSEEPPTVASVDLKSETVKNYMRQLALEECYENC